MKTKDSKSSSGCQGVQTLANGLRVVLVPCEAESVAVGVFIKSGSRHEPPEFAGISHLIEHMLFKGTPTRRAIDISREIEGCGGRFNAMTGEEATVYYTHLPDDHLADAVDVLSDMYLRATIPDDDFVREKQVVIEEIKMYADDPGSVAMENLQRALFKGSTLGEPIAGTPESLAPLRPADLRRYIRSHYRADNTIVIVVGSFDPGAALALVERAFSPLKHAKNPPSAKLPRLPRHSPSHVSVEKDVQQTQLALGCRMFGAGDPRKYAVTVLNAVLGGGMSSRLFQEIREKRGLSYDIASRVNLFDDAGMFTVAAGLDSSKAEQVVATIDREFARICERRVPAAELRRTKDFLIGNFKLTHESVMGKLLFYGNAMLAFGRAMPPSEQIDGIRAVTPSDLQSLARAVFAPANRSVSWVVPRIEAKGAQ